MVHHALLVMLEVFWISVVLSILGVLLGAGFLPFAPTTGLFCPALLPGTWFIHLPIGFRWYEARVLDDSFALI